MSHIMLDLETLGNKAGCVVLSIGACTFDGRRTFHQYLDLEPQLQAGLHIDPSTVMWWLQQSDGARNAQTAATRQHPVKVLTEFAVWCSAAQGETIWGHGLNFDLPILEAAYTAFAQHWPWNFRAGRDTRTLFDLAGKKMGAYGTPNPLAHDALSDAIYQAAETALCLAELRGKLFAPAG